MFKRTLPGQSACLRRVVMIGLALCLAASSLLASPRPVQAADLTISFTGSSLPAEVGTAWSRQFTASGGTAPYTCSMSGSVPGLSFNTATCQISGTPSDFGSYPVTISFTDHADPANSGSTVLDLRAEAPTQIATTLTSTHPDGETHFVAGFAVWVHANVSFVPAISGRQPAGTITVSSGGGGPSCSVDLDENGEGECALTFDSTGTKTISVNYPGATDVRSSATSSSISVEALHVPVTLSAGRNHTCHLASDGLMTCWGLADALPVDAHNQPVAQGYFSKISAGGYQTCGLKVDGTIACWGDNTDVTLNIPSGQFVDISSGDEHVCAVDNVNHLHCWGNLSTELANVPSIKVLSVSAGVNFDCAIRKSNQQPVCWGSLTTAPSIAVRSLAVGNTHVCALKTDGSLQCWGTPGMTVPAGTSFTRVDSGSAYSCAQKTDSTFTCWGTGNPGPDTTTPYDDFASGFLHTCALKTSGTTHSLSCWGDNAYRKAPHISLLPTGMPPYMVQGDPFSQTFTPQDGNPPYTVSVASGSLPDGLTLSGDTVSGTLEAPGLYSFALSAAETFPGGPLSLAITPGMRSYTTTVIDGTTTASLTLPERVNAGSPAVAHVTISTVQALPAITGNVTVSNQDGGSYCRAQVNSSGVAQCTLFFSQTGLQSVSVAYEGDSYYQPSTAGGEITVDAVVIAAVVGAGDQFSCSIDSDGQLACWGDTEAFQLPVPTSGVYDQMDAGKAHACALGLNRQVTCWGWNGYGIASPPEMLGVTHVTTGSEHSCALNDLGVVTCWGNGDANRLNVPNPGVGITYNGLDAGASHTCAIDSTGMAKCWGLNGTQGQTDVPADLLSRGAATRITSGGTFSCVVHEGGSLECWGGIGTIDSIRSEPAGVFSDISAGQDFACGLRENGAVTCWGSLTTAPAGPFTQISAGYDHACGLLSSGRVQCWGGNAQGQAPVITILPASLPAVDAGTPWSTALSAAGGRVSEYTYTVTEGALPPGLNLDTNSGAIAGTPEQAGVYTFAIQAQESHLTPAVAGTQPYTLTIRGRVNASIDSALPAGVMEGKPVRVAFSVHARAGNDMGAEPSGVVTVSAAGNRCEVELSGGQGSCLMLFAEAGPKPITLTYMGDGLYQPADPLAGGLEYSVMPFNQPPQLRTGVNQTYTFKPDGTLICTGSGCQMAGRFTQLGAGDLYTCGLRTDGSVICLGLGGSPAPVFDSGPYIDLSVGKNHVCALQIDGRPQCLGNDSFGQSSPPVQTFSSISAGAGHTCALKENGEATCWGQVNDPLPGPFTLLVSGDAHTCGLRPGGELACWDADHLGPISLPGTPGVFSQITAGGAQTCGLDLDGKLTCWQVSTPEQPYSLYGKFIALAAYDDHGCALRDGLKRSCWGEDDAGEAPQFAFDPLINNVITVQTYFRHAFNVSGGTKPLTAEVVEGALPPGISVDPDNAAITSNPILQDLSPAGMILYGTPSLPGAYPFVIRWTDASPGQVAMEQPYTLTVTGANLALDLIPFSPSEALLGLEYKFKAVVTNQTALAVPGAVLTIHLPDKLTGIKTDSSTCTRVALTLTCLLDSVDPAQPTTIWVTGLVSPQTTQPLQFSASVDSPAPGWPEIEPDDNAASFSVKAAYKSAVLEDDFDQVPATGWTGGTLETAPDQETTYLSVAGNTSLFLDCNDLAAHQFIVIRFDLYVIGDWLGNNPTGDASEWAFGLVGSDPVLDTSFSNTPAFLQAYPDRLPAGANPARMGNAGMDELGYLSSGSPLPDTRYQLTFKIPHTTEDLHLVFRSLNLPDGAWWGLDSVTVSIDSGRTQLFLPLTAR